MYRLTLTRAGRPDEERTARTPGEIRNAVWDLVRAAGWTIRDEDHAHLIAASGLARSEADIHGASVAYIDGTAVTSRPYDETEEAPDITPRLIIRADQD
ncbi:hypothetical protein [Streptomyces sp. OE57]|uniref:hypothetical protein n=1 Tax=Streptomyces lacaronensis TaxID=3379885 RepID=UPI0039B77693